MSNFMTRIHRYIIGLFLVLTLGFCGVAPVGTQVPAPAPAVVSELETYNCFYAVVLHEAEAESIKGKKAVTDVVINRVRAKGYPSSVCEVVTQEKQFSYINRTLSKAPSSLYTASNKKVNAEVAKAAYEGLQSVLRGSRTGINALHYHANYVRPSWSKHKKLVAVIGKHRFYA